MTVGDRFVDTYVSRVRASYIPRWVEYTHEVKPDYPEGEYDLTIPEIHIEWMLCDLSVMRLVKSKKHRQKFYDMLTPEELDVWFNRTDEDGNRYCDLEKDSLTKAIVKGRRANKRGNNAQ